jgi:hypothetical protein
MILQNALALVAALRDVSSLDLPVVVCLAASLVVGLTGWEALRDRRAWWRGPVIALAMVFAVLLIGDPNLGAAPTFWFALALLGAGLTIAELGPHVQIRSELNDRAPTLADAGTWLAVGLVGAALLEVVGALTLAANPGSAAAGPFGRTTTLLLIVLGAISLGLPPFGGWRRGLARRDPVGLLVDGLLPLVGVSLAARGLETPLAGGDGLTTLVLLALGGLGIAAGLRLVWRADHLVDLRLATGQLDAGLAYLGLGLGTRPAIAAAVALVAIGAISRAATRVPTRHWSRWLGWASLVGLPPLPGFLARWLFLGVALSTGPWPLALAIGVAVPVATVGVFRQFVNLGVAGSHPVESEPVQPGGLSLASLALVALALVPTGFVAQTLAPLSFASAAGARALLSTPALLIALLPLPLAIALPPTARRHRAATASPGGPPFLWGLAQQLGRRLAGATWVIEDRYDLAAGLLVALAVFFAFVE